MTILDILSGNRKLILGLLWSLIHYYLVLGNGFQGEGGGMGWVWARASLRFEKRLNSQSSKTIDLLPVFLNRSEALVWAKWLLKIFRMPFVKYADRTLSSLLLCILDRFFPPTTSKPLVFLWHFADGAKVRGGKAAVKTWIADVMAGYDEIQVSNLTTECDGNWCLTIVDWCFITSIFDWCFITSIIDWCFITSIVDGAPGFSVIYFCHHHTQRASMGQAFRVVSPDFSVSKMARLSALLLTITRRETLMLIVLLV